MSDHTASGSALAEAQRERAHVAEKEIARLKAENASLLEWKAKAMLRLIELEPVHDELAAAEQRAEAAEKRNTELEGVLRKAFEELTHMSSMVEWRVGFHQSGPIHLARASEQLRAALHDEERSAPLSAADCPECPEEGCVLDADHEEPCDTDIPETAADEERSAPQQEEGK